MTLHVDRDSQNRLLSIFPGLCSMEGVISYLQHITVNSISILKKSKRIKICLCSGIYIRDSVISAVEQHIAQHSDIKNVELTIVYSCYSDEEGLTPDYWNNVIFFVCRQNAGARTMLRDSEPFIEGNKLKIKLSTPAACILYAQKCDAAIQNILKQQIGKNPNVEFIDPVAREQNNQKYKQLKTKYEEQLIRNILSQNGQSKAESASNIHKSDENAPNYEIIIGSKFDGCAMDICDINRDSGKVIFSGDILSVQTKDIKNEKVLFIIDVTDYTSTVTVKFFTLKKNCPDINGVLKIGICVIVRGKAQFDKFSNELIIMASDIRKIEKHLITDDAEQKRVELHVHTQMSQLDGVTPAASIIKRAAEWGHTAIAITDHGVVQAFPEASQAGRKNNIKIIYGIECYLVDDIAPKNYDAIDYTIDDEFVVIDVETTGLSARNDSIIEIGAVKIRKGEIVETYTSFVNPNMHISEDITQLTGISDDMVKDAPTIEQILPQFIKFIGNSVIVAHNAMFDLGFIRHAAEKTGLDINNIVLDTLELCRKLIPGLKSYKLGNLAEHIGLDMQNCHRALDDSILAAKLFLDCVEKLRKKKIKTVYEIQKKLSSKLDLSKMESHHAILLVKNQAGLKNLYKIVSASHIEYFYKKPRVPKSLLIKYRDGLILGSACESGELFSSIVQGRSKEEIDRIVEFYDYLEIQPIGNNGFLINRGIVKSKEELIALNRQIVSLGEIHNKPVVATCDVHFLDKKDEVFRKILMAGQGYEDADEQAPLYFRTTDEMLEEFAYLDEVTAHRVVITNTRLIADMIEDVIPIPEQTFPPKIEGAEDKIKTLVEDRTKQIYGDAIPDVVRQRLDKELNAIIKNGFSVMYLIAQKLVSKSIEDGYLVGSRGSVGSSFVATMAGITEVNPLPAHYICPECKYNEFVSDSNIGCGVDMEDKLCPRCGKLLKRDGYNIPFETFLGFDGDKEPDIDLNFSGEYQAKAHKYTEEIFGADHVFRAGTIATVASKTAYGFVKNYLDERGKPATNAEINRLVNGCTGIKRTTGQHPGGLMIVPRDNDIHNFSPIQRPADDVSSETTTTHFDYSALNGRLLKLDILGHDDPTIIKMLEDITGINATQIPIGEKTTMGIFRGTEPLGIKPEDINSLVGTFGIPEFGTKFVRQMLVDTKPTTFSELIRISGLSHGTDVWLNNAQDVIKKGIASLSEVICTRDDIMTYLLYKGLEPKIAFKIMEDVRKGKGLKPEYEQAMIDKSVPDWYIQSCKKIKYMFPKAHAAAYVMMAFRIAWFKVHYPKAFYTAHFTIKADEFDASITTKQRDTIRKMIKELEQRGNDITQKDKNMLGILEVVNEMYARGIKFAHVDLYASDAAKFCITPEGIRPPLKTLQGLGESAAQNIVNARRKGKFLSIDDLRVRAKLTKAVIEILQKHKCLDDLPDSNQISLF